MSTHGMNADGPRLSGFRHPISLLLMSWTVYLACIALLQFFGAGIGFQIWPVGEDRNWVYLLRGDSIKQTFLEFWSLDHRNPMAAFWWLIASPIIKSSDWGLHAVAQLVSPIVACATFLTIDRLGGSKNRLFALFVALITLIWGLSARHDHVDRVMIIALTFTLLSIYYYTGFVDSYRTRKISLVISLTCYLIALATYTIQSGAIIAVPFIAYFRNTGTPGFKIRRAILDSIIFFSVFVLYTSVWMYFAGANSGFKIGLVELINNSISSLKAFVYPPSIGQFIGLAYAEFTPHEQILYFIVAMVVSALMVLGITLASRCTASAPPIGWALLLLVAIGLPTIFVEAGNPTWGPGSRSIMVQQVWEPLFLITVIFSVIAVIKPRTIRTGMATLLIWALCSFTLFVVLGFNHFQTDVTFYQRNLAVALRTIDAGQTEKVNYIIKLVNKVSAKAGSEPTLPSYAPTVIGRENTFIRVLMTSPSPIASYDSVWRVRFDTEGVSNGGAFFDRTIVPYKNIKVINFDGITVSIPKELTKADFEGFQVDWMRDLPISQ